MALFSRLLPPLASAYGFQASCALVFVPQATETYYDLCGALGFLSTTFISLYYPALKDRFHLGKPGPLTNIRSFAPRQLLLSGCLALWSTRLGTFLVSRAIKAGGDSRFDRIRNKPLTFTYYWMAQATWVFLVGLPVYLVNTLPARLHPALGARDYLSLGLFTSSFLFEVLADYQKTAWRKAKDSKKHDQPFISSGLWSISRHPNYVGEVGIWSGMWALSTPSIQSGYPFWMPVVAAASPVFTYLLTRYVSGVPPLERAGDKKWGNDARWKEYKKTVPVFWPFSSSAKL